MTEQIRDFSQAKAYALRLVKFRPRSQKEIIEKLTGRGFGSDIIGMTVVFLKKAKVIDDALFADLWVKARIKKPLGFARLRYELKAKGIEKDTIEEVLDKAKEGYCEEEIVRGIIKNKAKSMQKLPVDKIRSRLYSYLIRRGFSRPLVMQALFSEGIKDEL